MPSLMLCRFLTTLRCVHLLGGSYPCRLTLARHISGGTTLYHSWVGWRQDYADGGFLMADGFVNEIDSLNPVMDDVEEIRVRSLDAPSILQHVAVRSQPDTSLLA